MNSDTLRPLPNFVLVAIPERFHAPKGPRSPDGLAITVLSGDDAMHELEAQIKRGGQLQIETETDRSIRNLVRVGQVLQIPPSLNDQMYLCAAGEGYRTFADITPVVEVGDTVYLDYSCLTDENEIMPGIYRVPYAAVICKYHYHVNVWNIEGKEVEEDILKIKPVGGYVLLSRVWAADVVDEPGEFGLVKCRKNAAGLITETSVPPLDNEGIVAWVHAPLKGTGNELHPGQRVLITKGQALTESICGTEYLCIRQDYVMAIKQPSLVDEVAPLVQETANQFQILQDYLRNTPAEELQAYWDAVGEIDGPTLSEVLAVQSRIDGEEVHTITYAHPTPHTLTISAEQAGDGEWLKRAGYHLPTVPASQTPFSDEVIDASIAKTVEAIKQNPFTKEFQQFNV